MTLNFSIEVTSKGKMRNGGKNIFLESRQLMNADPKFKEGSSPEGEIGRR